MISRQDIQRLLHHEANGAPILSVFLDMSVNEVNKRTYRTFLSQERSRLIGLNGDRPGHPRDPLGAAFDRVQEWIDEEFDVSNKGAAIYAAVGGEWLEGLQFPVQVANRVSVGPHPVVSPLVELVERPHHYGVIVVDREWLKLIDLRLGIPVAEEEVKTTPYPTPGDVKAGGEAAKGYQKWKAEESRRFFEEFTAKIEDFVGKYRPDGLILMGTQDNVERFARFLPEELRRRIVHLDNAPVVPTTASVIERLGPFLEEDEARNEAESVDRLRERVGEGSRAVSGVEETLLQLQEGKLDTLVLSRHLECEGTQCLRCGFYLTAPDGACTYCGGEIEAGVDLVEAMIRLAAEQEVDITFTDPGATEGFGGVGGLLRF